MKALTDTSLDAIVRTYHEVEDEVAAAFRYHAEHETPLFQRLKALKEAEAAMKNKGGKKGTC